MWDERLNTTIDEVARQMTAAAHDDEGVGFRRRVLARIDAAETPRAHWSAALVLSPIAVAVAIAIGIAVVRDFQPRVPGPQQVARQPTDGASKTQVAPPTDSRAGREPVAAKAPPRHTAGVAAAAVRSARSSREGGASLQPALEVDPLDVAPLTLEMLQPDPIPVDRLETIAPILVAPLDITDVPRRNQ